MAAAGINPFAVEAVELVVIMYALILSEVEGGEGNGNAVLAMIETYLAATVEHHLDGAALARTHQTVVDLEVAETQGNGAQGVDVGGVEHGDALGTSEYQTAVGQLTRGTVHELVACQTVGLIERGDTPGLGVETVQAFHRTDPEVALMTLLDAGHIGTGETRYARNLIGHGVIAQQAVADGAYPHEAMAVLMHVGRDIHTATDALLKAGNPDLGQLARRGIHPCDILVEGGYEHLSVAELQQRGDEGVVDVERLLGLGLTAAGVEAVDVGGARCHPHRSVVGLLKVHRHGHGPLSKDTEPETVVATLHDEIARREPQGSVTVAEDVVDGAVRLSGRQTLDHHLLCFPGVAVIDKHALRQG